MIYHTNNNLAVGFHFIDVHGIWCEYEFISGARIHHLIHGETVDKKFWNLQHILEAFGGQFNPSFVGDFDRRVVPHKNRGTFA
jgi:hypothetical protein